jgi:protocatechuate 3,4-dioxygenase beta subunit
VTQLYFAGDVLNQHDSILKSLHSDDQKKVVVPFDRTNMNGDNVLKGRFDITLKKV